MVNRKTDINFIKIEALAQVFFCKVWEIFKNNVFTEHVWKTASVLNINKYCLITWVLVLGWL